MFRTCRPFPPLPVLLLLAAGACSESGPPTGPDPDPDPDPDPEGPSFDPGFADPTNVRALAYDAGLTAQENGDALEVVLESLAAGDRVVIGGGTWVVNGRLGIVAPGTAADPIVIEAEDGADVVLTRDDASQNVVNLDAITYLTVRNIEITGGSNGVKIYDANYLYFVDNEVHHTGDAAITANAGDTSHLYFIDNRVHHTGGSGEGFYLGGNFASVVTHHTYVIGNHVHDTAASTQGDGIELKTGSWACIISDNLVERTNYPGILVYGNGGRPERNVIERNVVIDALDNAVQVASDAIVRNNLIIGAGASALASQPHQDATPSNLDIVNNTIVNAGTALRASSWGAGIVVANNALYSETDAHVVGDTTTATMAGNVMLADLSGFADLAVDGNGRDATPTAASPAAGAGDPAWESADDLTGAARAGDPDAGAVDAD